MFKIKMKEFVNYSLYKALNIKILIKLIFLRMQTLHFPPNHFKWNILFTSFKSLRYKIFF